jgi:hypothetical protein
MTRRPSNDVLRIKAHQGFALLCFPNLLPPELVVLMVVEMLNGARPRTASPWIIAAGISPSHWQGLTQWVLISDDIPAAVMEGLHEQLDAAAIFDHFEATELTTLKNEPFAKPRFCIDDQGVSLLVTRDQYDPTWTNPWPDLPMRQRIYELC